MMHVHVCTHCLYIIRVDTYFQENFPMPGGNYIAGFCILLAMECQQSYKTIFSTAIIITVPFTMNKYLINIFLKRLEIA